MLGGDATPLAVAKGVSSYVWRCRVVVNIEFELLFVHKLIVYLVSVKAKPQIVTPVVYSGA